MSAEPETGAFAPPPAAVSGAPQLPRRTIWWNDDGSVGIIDQTRLPHDVIEIAWYSLADAAHGIRSMQVRGAPLIGVAAAHGLAVALGEDPAELHNAADVLARTRPTAVNLRWALDRMVVALEPVPPRQRAAAARVMASDIANEDVATCRRIGEHGVALLERIAAQRPAGVPLNVLTHCNAGWLACVEWGTATAPIYVARERLMNVHVWVSETRPRNQGASLTAWELADAGVPHTLVVDNAAGHLLRHGMVDLVIVGADRIAANGDAANKIGTYLKAVAAHDNGVPCYVAAPWSTFDPWCPTGDQVPIEERDADEVLTVHDIALAPPSTPARNWGFDVTPARLITAFITDRGVLSTDDVANAITAETNGGT